VVQVTATGNDLLRYLDELRVRESGNPRATGATAVARALVPAGLRPALKARLTRLRMPRTRMRARSMLASGAPIRLHFGCGEIHLSGWANVDMVGAGAADFIWDLRQPLPFPDGSVDAIFHEHLLEHLSYWDGVGLFRECRRLLRPGAVLRLGVPDFGRYARDYVRRAGFIDEVRGGRPTPLLALAEIAYCYQHVSMWDAETLVSLFVATGFGPVEVRESGDSRLHPAPDTGYRKPETLYVEGVACPALANANTNAIAPAEAIPPSRAFAKEIHP
jgi:SAM-dependent methyltransferase